MDTPQVLGGQINQTLQIAGQEKVEGILHVFGCVASYTYPSYASEYATLNNHAPPGLKRLYVGGCEFERPVSGRVYFNLIEPKPVMNVLIVVHTIHAGVMDMEMHWLIKGCPTITSTIQAEKLLLGEPDVGDSFVRCIGMHPCPTENIMHVPFDRWSEKQSYTLSFRKNHFDAVIGLDRKERCVNDWGAFVKAWGKPGVPMRIRDTAVAVCFHEDKKAFEFGLVEGQEPNSYEIIGMPKGECCIQEGRLTSNPFLPTMLVVSPQGLSDTERRYGEHACDVVTKTPFLRNNLRCVPYIFAQGLRTSTHNAKLPARLDVLPLLDRLDDTQQVWCMGLEQILNSPKLHSDFMQKVLKPVGETVLGDVRLCSLSTNTHGDLEGMPSILLGNKSLERANTVRHALISAPVGHGKSFLLLLAAQRLVLSGRHVALVLQPGWPSEAVFDAVFLNHPNVSYARPSEEQYKYPLTQLQWQGKPLDSGPDVLLVDGAEWLISAKGPKSESRIHQSGLGKVWVNASHVVLCGRLECVLPQASRAMFKMSLCTKADHIKEMEGCSKLKRFAGSCDPNGLMLTPALSHSYVAIRSRKLLAHFHCHPPVNRAMPALERWVSKVLPSVMNRADRVTFESYISNAIFGQGSFDAKTFLKSIATSTCRRPEPIVTFVQKRRRLEAVKATQNSAAKGAMQLLTGEEDQGSDDLTECPICLSDSHCKSEGIAFLCKEQHFVCKPCLENMKRRLRYQCDRLCCPMCRAKVNLDTVVTLSPSEAKSCFEGKRLNVDWANWGGKPLFQKLKEVVQDTESKNIVVVSDNVMVAKAAMKQFEIDSKRVKAVSTVAFGTSLKVDCNHVFFACYRHDMFDLTQNALLMTPQSTVCNLYCVE